MSKFVFSDFPSLTPSRNTHYLKLSPCCLGFPRRLAAQGKALDLQPRWKHIRTFPPYKLHRPRAFLSLTSQRGKTKTARVFLVPLLKIFAFQKEKVWMMYSHKGQISNSGIVGSLILPVGRYLENVF